MPKKKKTHRESIYIGVDPGKNGGIVLINQSYNNIDLFPMPTTERDIWSLFDSLVCTHQMKAMIEKVHSMPNQGVSSSFKFGLGYGGLRMALTAARISFEDVLPRIWQKGLGIPPRKKWKTPRERGETETQWKDKLRAKAQQLFPELPVWSQTKTEQRQICDALLIATYCMRKDQGKL